MLSPGEAYTKSFGGHSQDVQRVPLNKEQQSRAGAEFHLHSTKGKKPFGFVCILRQNGSAQAADLVKDFCDHADKFSSDDQNFLTSLVRGNHLVSR
jgi:hypothetical protein